MKVHSFRAKSIQEALALVRRELGPDAAVLHTREVNGGMLRWLGGSRQIEVIATNDEIDLPTQLPELESEEELATYAPSCEDYDPRARFQQDLAANASSGLELTSLTTPRRTTTIEPTARLLAQLSAAEWPAEFAHEYLDRLQDRADTHDLTPQLAALIENDLPLCRPIHLSPDECRVIALVGPTGVGKTTTIAKLAADFRLQQRLRVGLITVDTYRIAAVEQLRTYADIINVPMEVVSTPREMREAKQRLSDLDVLLIDTAGRSPRDELKLRELRAMLTEVRPDEVHLVLSTTASANSLVKSAEQFADLHTTALVLTKIDEAHGLGNVLPLVRSAKLPLSYVTHGQNVPDDIAVADRRKLARLLVGMPQERSHA